MPGGRQGTPGFDPGRMKDCRLALHMTQAELATIAGHHVKEVREWESGRRVPQVEAVAALARALTVSPLDLIRRDADEAITLQQLRANAGLSQQSVADRAGLLRTTYSQVERGEVLTLSDRDAAAIAGALDAEPIDVIVAHAASRAAYQDRRGSANGRK